MVLFSCVLTGSEGVRFGNRETEANVTCCMSQSSRARHRCVVLDLMGRVNCAALTSPSGIVLREPELSSCPFESWWHPM